jgi:hypothetical protein
MLVLEMVRVMAVPPRLGVWVAFFEFWVLVMFCLRCSVQCFRFDSGAGEVFQNYSGASEVF